MAALPRLPHADAAALQGALMGAVRNGCSGWGTVMAPALHLATELMDGAAKRGSGFAMSLLCALSHLAPPMCNVGMSSRTHQQHVESPAKGRQQGECAVNRWAGNGDSTGTCGPCRGPDHGGHIRGACPGARRGLRPGAGQVACWQGGGVPPIPQPAGGPCAGAANTHVHAGDTRQGEHMLCFAAVQQLPSSMAPVRSFLPLIALSCAW